jgi:hypothetical protein
MCQEPTAATSGSNDGLGRAERLLVAMAERVQRDFRAMYPPLIENPETRWPGPINGPLPPVTMTHPKCKGCGEYLGMRPGEWCCHKNECQEPTA